MSCIKGPAPDNPMAFVNVWAFTANLFERRIFRTNPRWAITCSADGLEGGYPGISGMGTTRDIQVLSAAQWILWYGQSLFKQVLDPLKKISRDAQREDDRGPFYRGEKGLSLERWHFWRNGFNAVALSGEEEKQKYSQECRDVAGKVADMMEVLERSMTPYRILV